MKENPSVRNCFSGCLRILRVVPNIVVWKSLLWRTKYTADIFGSIWILQPPWCSIRTVLKSKLGSFEFFENMAFHDAGEIAFQSAPEGNALNGSSREIEVTLRKTHIRRVDCKQIKKAATVKYTSECCHLESILSTISWSDVSEEAIAQWKQNIF